MIYIQKRYISRTTLSPLESEKNKKNKIGLINHEKSQQTEEKQQKLTWKYIVFGNRKNITKEKQKKKIIHTSHQEKKNSKKKKYL